MADWITAIISKCTGVLNKVLSEWKCAVGSKYARGTFPFNLNIHTDIWIYTDAIYRVKFIGDLLTAGLTAGLKWVWFWSTPLRFWSYCDDFGVVGFRFSFMSMFTLSLDPKII